VHQSGIGQGIERGQTAPHTTHMMPQEHRDRFRIALHDLGYHDMGGYFQKAGWLILVHF